ncbi:hypothetical protein FA95DRAFT_1548706 [Auriscalpium vulgare]|uniref:Uncharacterized protein n=1 Tax=Auriscalpium vulgare TaxID=40419 RepID=A0ACB8RD35_9AGAM|nr:hypothetical protein FA95DRAFT_1548706 [Auriscalpium vulgare]
MTFASLRALQAIIADALDEIQAAYNAASSSPPSSDSDRDSQFHTPSVSASSFVASPPKPRRPPTPPLLSIPTPTPTPTRSEFLSSPPSSPSQYSASFSQVRDSPRPAPTTLGLDFPALDAPGDITSPSELLSAHPDVGNAISRIIAAAEQMAVTVRPPFLTLCDASMGYHLPSCLRFLEATHICELLRAAGPDGMSVTAIAEKVHIEPVKISHNLRLLATHHILLEKTPDVFALNRVSALLDSGKPFEEVVSVPNKKYDEGGGAAAFIALNTDELFKASAYLTDALLPHTLPEESVIKKSLQPLPTAPSKNFPAASPSPLSLVEKTDAISPMSLEALTPTSLAPPITLTESTPDKRNRSTVALSMRSRSRSPSPSPSPTSNPQPFASSPGSSTPNLISRANLVRDSPISGPKPLPSPLMIPTTATPPIRSPKSPRSFSSTPVIRRLLSRPKLNPDTESTLSPRSHSRSPGAESRSPQSTAMRSPQAPPVPDLPPYLRPLAPPQQRQDQEQDQKPSVPLTAFNLSQRTASSFWTWLEAPGNEARLARFGRAMGGSEGWEGRSEEDLCAYPFPYLQQGGLVVDVGGGIGSSTMRLAERFPGLKFVVQDREAVCRLGEEAWHTQCPEMLESGRIKFQVHDFFTPQPMSTSRPSVFLLRVVCHDWPDAFARRILLQLRRAASEGDGSGQRPTYLVIGDHILPYACANEQDSEDAMKLDGMEGIDGAERAQALRGVRWPLLANLGKASSNAYWMDLTMQVTFNGQERTLPEFIDLCASAGWKITRVSRAEGSLFGHIIAVPATLPTPLSPSLSLGTPTPVTAWNFDATREDLPAEIVARASTPALDMFGSGRELPLVGLGRGGPAVEKKRGMWIRWMKGRGRKEASRAGVLEGDTWGLKEEGQEEGLGIGGSLTPPYANPGFAPSLTGERQGKGLFKKVSQYFVE